LSTARRGGEGTDAQHCKKEALDPPGKKISGPRGASRSPCNEKKVTFPNPRFLEGRAVEGKKRNAGWWEEFSSLGYFRRSPLKRGGGRSDARSGEYRTSLPRAKSAVCRAPSMQGKRRLRDVRAEEAEVTGGITLFCRSDVSAGGRRGSPSSC